MTETQERHQVDLIDAMEEAVCFLAADNTIVFTNARLEEMTDKGPGELAGESFQVLFPTDQHHLLEVALDRARKEGHVRIHMGVLSPRKREPIPVLLRLVAYTDPEGESAHVYAVMLDLSELSEALKTQEFLRQRNRELEDLAITCPLTGVFNRRYFDYRYEEEMARARRYLHGMAVAFVDLDHFKSINDTHGHAAGDIVLREVARTLARSLRSTDIVARYGGEEFVVLMPEVRPEGALAVGIRMRMALQRKRIKVEKQELQATASIGIASVTPSEPVPEDEELLKRADESLYRAKRAGRNRVVLWGHPIE